MKRQQKKIYTAIILSLLIYTSIFFINCGIIVPNQALVEIMSDSTNDDTGFVGTTLREVIVNGNKTRKASDIARGKSILFQISWWGKNQYIAPISYYINDVDKTKKYIQTSITVKNFDKLKLHLHWDSSKHNRIEKKE